MTHATRKSSRKIETYGLKYQSQLAQLRDNIVTRITRSGEYMYKAGREAVQSGRKGAQYAGPLAIGGGMMIGARMGVTAGMTALGVTGLLPLMATTALASGIVGAGMYWAMEWAQARKNGTNPPEILSRARLGQGLNTAANVATVGIFGLTKSAFQAASQRNFKTLFDWRDPASYLKLGVYAGAAYAGFNLYDAHQDQIADLTRDLDLTDYGEDIQPALESVTRTTPQAFGQLGDTFNEAVAYNEGVAVENPPEPEAPANSSEMSSLLETAGEQVGTDSPAILQDALDRAESGNPQGMKDLAQAFLTGQHGAEQDTDLALKLYESAAEAGNEQARQDLAIIDRLGIDYFERQPLIQEAQEHLEGVESQYLRDTLKSAESGNSQDLKDLGHALLHGRGGAQQDTELAYKLYERAAAAGNEQALTDLAYIDKVGLDHFEHDDTETVAQDSQRAAVAGNKQAINDLATIEQLGKDDFTQKYAGSVDPAPHPDTRPNISNKIASIFAKVTNDGRVGFSCNVEEDTIAGKNPYVALHYEDDISRIDDLPGSHQPGSTIDSDEKPRFCSQMSAKAWHHIQARPA